MVCMCSRCHMVPPRPNQRYCLDCHAASVREFRHRTPLTAEQKFKDNARSYAGVYKRRGKLTIEPCENCGSSDSEMHHEDYTKPIDIHWLCRSCHLALHNQINLEK